MEIWDDGRSGLAGCAAGNLVLAEILREDGEVRKIKGTLFESPKHVFVGRVCSSDDYLHDPLMHWANLSWDQHRDVQERAAAQNKEVAYLFITAVSHPPSINYWQVPGACITRVLTTRNKNHMGATCAVHILKDDAKHRLADIEITRFHRSVGLNEAGKRLLESGFKAPRRFARDPNQKMEVPVPAQDQDQFHSFDFPISGGRVGRIEVPVPLSSTDVSRIKSWLDLTADALTESHPSIEARRERQWLREQVEIGLAELAEGKAVDGEAAVERILQGRGQKRGVSA